MKMKKYEVRFSVDGKPCGSIPVEASSTGEAHRLALGELQGRAGYGDKKIKILGSRSY